MTEEVLIFHTNNGFFSGVQGTNLSGPASSLRTRLRLSQPSSFCYAYAILLLSIRVGGEMRK